MTYCVALRLTRGLVLMSDTRTNAGVDNVSIFPKMFHFDAPGERSLTLLTAGNLATTQAVVSMLEERAKAPHERDPGLLSVPSMFQAARLVGATLREVIEEQAQGAASPIRPSRPRSCSRARSRARRRGSTSSTRRATSSSPPTRALGSRSARPSTAGRSWCGPSTAR